MINTQNYETKEFTPAQSVSAAEPRTRLRRTRKKKKSHFVEEIITARIHPRDLNFLSDFIKVSGFYIEDLEDFIGEELMDFWQNREHALRIVTDVMLQRVEEIAAF